MSKETVKKPGLTNGAARAVFLLLAMSKVAVVSLMQTVEVLNWIIFEHCFLVDRLSGVIEEKVLIS